MTDERWDKLDALAAAATPGPWVVGESDQEFDWFLAQTGHAIDCGIWASQPVAARETAAARRGEEIENHIPTGYEDMTGYGQVSCSCGWDSSDVLGWEQHINAAALHPETTETGS